jgi:PAS domain S-box-containing protein
MMGKVRILLVEDERIVARDIVTSLEALGYEVCASVPSGEEALEKAEKMSPHLVLMDIRLKGEMNGVESADRIRKRFHIPVIYLTSYADQETLSRAKVTEPYGYILKPFEERELHVAIEMALYKHGSERRLKESEQWLATTLKSINDGVITTDPDGLVTFMNPVAEVLTGWELKEVVRKPLKEVFDIAREEVGKQVEDPVGKVLQEGIVAELAKRTILIARDGRKLPLEGSAAPIKDEKGGAIGAILAFRDISERRRAEEALLESEEKYRLLVQNANDAIFIAQEGVIKFPNPRAETLIGYSSTELANMPFINLVHPADRNTVMASYRHGLDGEKVPVFSFRGIDRAGTEKWVEVNGIALKWEGKPATLVFLRDITEQKNLESRLMQAQKLEAIGTLAGGIAHDFNNILSAIVGYAELISWEVRRGSRAERNLQELLKASHRARDLVQQILTFSRQGRQEQKLVEMGPIVKETLKLLRASLPSSIEIRQEIEKDIGKIEADPTQIHQVLMNLCTNAGHAMRKNGGLLKVSLSNIDMDASAAAQYPNVLPGPFIRLSVSDTGHGMSPEVLERIFDPYFTTKDVDEGTGLGLAVVHGIVESYRGAITVYSEPGNGTNFHVYFPQIDQAKEVADTQQIEPLLMGRNERILFIDDEQPLVDVGDQILKSLKYEVTIGTSSIEALEIFRKQPERFDLVITDMTMPNMTGDKLAKELLRIRPDIPIVLCTGFSERITGEAAKEMGIREFAMKPLVASDLAKTIRRALDQQKKKWPE